MFMLNIQRASGEGGDNRHRKSYMKTGSLTIFSDLNQVASNFLNPQPMIPIGFLHSFKNLVLPSLRGLLGHPVHK